MPGAESNCIPLPGPRSTECQTLPPERASGRRSGPSFLQPDTGGRGGSLWIPNLEYRLRFTKDLQAGCGGVGGSEAPSARSAAAPPPRRRRGTAASRGFSARCPTATSVGGERRNKGHSSTNSEFAYKCQSHCLFLEASTSAQGYDQDVLAWRISSRPAMPGPSGAYLPARSLWGLGEPLSPYLLSPKLGNLWPSPLAFEYLGSFILSQEVKASRQTDPNNPGFRFKTSTTKNHPGIIFSFHLAKYCNVLS